MSFHVYLFLSMPMFLLFSVHLVFNPSRHLSICAFVHPSIYLSIYLPIHLSTVPIYISSCIAIYLSTYSILSYLPTKTHTSVIRMYPMKLSTSAITRSWCPQWLSDLRSYKPAAPDLSARVVERTTHGDFIS